jgi:hypothetical protein
MHGRARAAIIAGVACSFTSYSKGATIRGRAIAEVACSVIADVAFNATRYSKDAISMHGRVRAAIIAEVACSATNYSRV